MKDIANKCGVSVATVSRVLGTSKSAVPISEATSKRVIDAANALGYRRNPFAAALVTGKTHSIGLISEIPINSFAADLIAGVQTVCNQNSYSLIFAHASHKATPDLLADAGLLAEHQVDAIIIGSTVEMEQSAEVIANLGALQRPVVLVDQAFSNCDLSFVVTDDFNGALSAVEHLIKLGHTRIGFASAGVTYTCSQRILGYREALAQAELPWDASLLQDGDFTEESGARMADNLLALPDPPTAIFAVNDVVAAGILRHLRERGIRVPEEMSVIGYGDLLWSDLIGLTTVRQPAFELGCSAAELVLRMIRDDDFLNRRVVLPVELVIRRSTDAPCSRRIIS